ncbi:MAG: mechanosensitive ion channel domain-containing protein [Spirochaetales bacterium]
MDTFWEDIVSFFNETGWKIILSLCLIVIGGVIIKYFAKMVQRLLYKTSIDNSIVSFIISIFKIALWILLLSVCASILELSTNSLLVVLSSMALAIGLALKDSLGNLTNGMFIIYNKPFKRGDHIKIDNVEGKVQNIKLLATELVTFDNRKLIIPNSKFTTDSIVNYTALPIRRIEMTFGVAYGSDMDYVERIIYKALDKENLILSFPKSSVFISAHGSSAVEWTVWAWVATDDYWTVWKALPKIMYKAFENAEIRIPFNQVDVHFDDGKPNLAKRQVAKPQVIEEKVINVESPKKVEAKPKPAEPIKPVTPPSDTKTKADVKQPKTMATTAKTVTQAPTKPGAKVEPKKPTADKKPAVKTATTKAKEETTKTTKTVSQTKKAQETKGVKNAKK